MLEFKNCFFRFLAITPLLVLARCRNGYGHRAQIIGSSLETNRGPLEVLNLPGLDHLDSGGKPQGTILPYITIYFGHHSSGLRNCLFEHHSTTME